MSNFFILENGPQASPGCCGVCGYSGKERKFLDPRKDFEDYGTFILCEDCVGAMANDFGFLNPVQSAALEQRLTEAESELVEKRAQLVQLETLGDLVAGLIGSKSAVPNADDSVALRDSKPAPSISDGTVEPEGSDDSIQRLLDFDVDKQIDESGPDDLSGLAERNASGFSL